MSQSVLPPWARYLPQEDAWILQVHIQPGAKANAVVGGFGERLKLKIAAPAVDNRANIALTRFIASLAGVSASKVAIERGNQGRQKTLRVVGAGPQLLSLLDVKEQSGKA